MFSERIEKLFLLAAEPTLERVKADRETAPPRLKPLLEHIEKHVFDADFSVAAMKQACGIGDNSIGSVFKEHFGEGPRGYVEDCRLVVASEVLARTSLAIWQVAELAGYSSVDTFSAAFERWCGLRPKRFRRAARTVVTFPAGELLARRFLRSVLEGDLDPAEARPLLQRLEPYLVLDEGREAPEPARVVLREGSVERAIAEDVWKAIADQSIEMQRATVKSYPLLVLFDVLREHSREEGRKDRQRGVELARLAMDVLRDVEASRREELPQHEALGWAYVGNALRLVPDHARAETAFAAGERAWARAGEPRSAVIEGEISFLKAALLVVQRDHVNADKLLRHATALLRRCGEGASQLYAEALLWRGNVLTYTERYSEAIEVLEEAATLVDFQKEPYQLVTVHGNLVTARALSGKHEEAEQLLPTAQALAAACGFRVAYLQLQWTDGLVRQARGDIAAAKRLLFKVSQELAERGELGYAAVVTLDCAILSAQQGHIGEVLARVAEALPALQALQLGPDVGAAVALVAEALPEGAMPLEILQEARRLLVAHFQLCLPVPR